MASAVRVSFVLGLVFCTTGASCTRTMRSPFAAWQPPAPQVLMTGSSLDQVITAVNDNAARIQSIQTNNASITVPGMPGIPLLGGKIAAQRPGRFHLVAGTALTGDEVDMGSNDELFWFWVKRNEPPALYYARHNQFAGSAAQQLMPIEPQWLLDAIGFTEFRPGDVHTGPTAARRRQGRNQVGHADSHRTTHEDEPSSTRRGPGCWSSMSTTRRERSSPARWPSRISSTSRRTSRCLTTSRFASPRAICRCRSTWERSRSTRSARIRNSGRCRRIHGVPLTDLGASQANAATPRMGDQITDANWYGPGPAVGQVQAAGVPMSIPVAPATAGLATMAPPTAAAQPTGPAPQFIHPSGVELPAASVAQQQSPYPAMQQLPAAGVAGAGTFTR